MKVNTYEKRILDLHWEKLFSFLIYNTAIYLLSGQSLNISANMDPHIESYLGDLVSGYTFVSVAWGWVLNAANVVIAHLYLFHSLWQYLSVFMSVNIQSFCLRETGRARLILLRRVWHINRHQPPFSE